MLQGSMFHFLVVVENDVDTYICFHFILVVDNDVDTYICFLIFLWWLRMM